MKFIHKNFFKLTLFVCTPLYSIATIAAAMIAPFSVMAFDTPGSEKLWTPWIMLVSIYGLAIFLFVADILIIIFSLQRKRRLLIYSLLLPAPFFIVLVIIFTISPPL